VAKHSVETCRESDLPELFSQFADWYRFNPRMQEPEYFAWQFRDPPTRLTDAEYDFLVLRNEAGRIAGCLGMVGFEFRHRGRIATGGWTHNWHSEGQGEGGLTLLGRFMELVDNRIFVRLNEISGRVLQLLRIPMCPAIPRWWAAIDPHRVAELAGMKDAADRAILACSAERFRANAAAPRAQLVARLAPDEEFRLEHFDGLEGHVRRTGRYLNWRYLDIPKHDYRIVRSERAFGVYRIETVMGADVGIIRLLEWTFPAEETGGALATVMAEAALRNPVLIDFHCTSRAVAAALDAFGFVPQTATQVSMPDLFRPTYRSGGYSLGIDRPPHRTRRTLDFDRWYITLGDSDVDRVKL